MNTNNQDYAEAIISIMSKIKNKSLLKRIYNLAEYLYIHVDGGAAGKPQLVQIINHITILISRILSEKSRLRRLQRLTARES
jgi:hypothetical protein